MVNSRYSRITPFGTRLRQKSTDGIVSPKLRQPCKPLLVIGITDGRPTREDRCVLEDSFRYAVDFTQKLASAPLLFGLHRTKMIKRAREAPLLSTALIDVLTTTSYRVSGYTGQRPDR